MFQTQLTFKYIKEREIKELPANVSNHSALPVQTQGVSVISNDLQFYYLEHKWQDWQARRTGGHVMESRAHAL